MSDGGSGLKKKKANNINEWKKGKRSGGWQVDLRGGKGVK